MRQARPTVRVKTVIQEVCRGITATTIGTVLVVTLTNVTVAMAVVPKTATTSVVALAVLVTQAIL